MITLLGVPMQAGTRVFAKEYGLGTVNKIEEGRAKPISIIFDSGLIREFTEEGKESIYSERSVVSPREEPTKSEPTSSVLGQYPRIYEIVAEVKSLKPLLTEEMYTRLVESTRALIVGDISYAQAGCEILVIKTGHGYKLLHLVQDFQKDFDRVSLTLDEGLRLIKMFG